MLKDAYNKMMAWAEECFPKSGGAIMRYLALSQASLVFPEIPYKSTTVRSNIHILVLGTPGIAKSALLKLYQKWAYRPIILKRGSTAGLEDYLEARSREAVSVVCDELAIVMNSKSVLKLLEGITGDGRVDTILATKVKKYDVNVCFVGAGVIQDLTSYIHGGWLSRLLPLLVFHNDEEQTEVGEHIGMNIGIPSGQEDIFFKIQEHHKQLVEIQMGKNPDIPTIVGAALPEVARKFIIQNWEKKRQKIDEDKNFVWYRELNDTFRLAIASAMLHVNERKIKKVDEHTGIVYPNEFDIRLGSSLGIDAMDIKARMAMLNSERSGLLKSEKLMVEKPWTVKMLTADTYDEFKEAVLE